MNSFNEGGDGPSVDSALLAFRNRPEVVRMELRKQLWSCFAIILIFAFAACIVALYLWPIFDVQSPKRPKMLDFGFVDRVSGVECRSKHRALVDINGVWLYWGSSCGQFYDQFSMYLLTIHGIQIMVDVRRKMGMYRKLNALEFDMRDGEITTNTSKFSPDKVVLHVWSQVDFERLKLDRKDNDTSFTSVLATYCPGYYTVPVIVNSVQVVHVPTTADGLLEFHHHSSPQNARCIGRYFYSRFGRLFDEMVCSGNKTVLVDDESTLSKKITTTQIPDDAHPEHGFQWHGKKPLGKSVQYEAADNSEETLQAIIENSTLQRVIGNKTP